MKTAEEAYEEWCGENKHINDCHPVHDSTETIEFAESFAKGRAVEFAIYEAGYDESIEESVGDRYDKFINE